MGLNKHRVLTIESVKNREVMYDLYFINIMAGNVMDFHRLAHSTIQIAGGLYFWDRNESRCALRCGRRAMIV